MKDIGKKLSERVLEVESHLERAIGIPEDATFDGMSTSTEGELSTNGVEEMQEGLRVGETPGESKGSSTAAEADVNNVPPEWNVEESEWETASEPAKAKAAAAVAKRRHEEQSPIIAVPSLTSPPAAAEEKAFMAVEHNSNTETESEDEFAELNSEDPSQSTALDAPPATSSADSSWLEEEFDLSLALSSEAVAESGPQCAEESAEDAPPGGRCLVTGAQADECDEEAQTREKEVRVEARGLGQAPLEEERATQALQDEKEKDERRLQKEDEKRLQEEEEQRRRQQQEEKKKTEEEERRQEVERRREEDRRQREEVEEKERIRIEEEAEAQRILEEKALAEKEEARKREEQQEAKALAEAQAKALKEEEEREWMRLEAEQRELLRLQQLEEEEKERATPEPVVGKSTSGEEGATEGIESLTDVTLAEGSIGDVKTAEGGGSDTVPGVKAERDALEARLQQVEGQYQKALAAMKAELLQQATSAQAKEEKLKKTLATREKQIESISTQNATLNQERNNLKDDIRRLKDETDTLRLKLEDQGSVDSLKQEFSARLGAQDRMINDLKKQLMAKKSQSASTGQADEQKDALIAELRQEGEKLSKKQLQYEQIIKQLRAKEKESEKKINDLTDRQTASDRTIAELNARLKELSEDTTKYKESTTNMKQLSESTAKKLEQQKLAADAAQAQVEELQKALEQAWQELGEQKRANTGRDTLTEQKIFERESSLKEEYTQQMRQQQAEARERELALSQTIDELRAEITRAADRYEWREEELRKQIQEMQSRFQEAESMKQDLSTSIAESSKPLLRQIETMQANFDARTLVWENLEQSLNRRLQEEEQKAIEAFERERSARSEANEQGLRVKQLESKLSSLKNTLTKLRADLETAVALREEAERENEQKAVQLDIQGQKYAVFMDQAKQQEHQLKKELATAQESLRKAQAQRAQLSSAPPSAQHSERSVAEPTEASPATGSLHRSASAASTVQLLQLRSGMLHSGSVERVQALVKQKEIEINALRTQVESLEQTRASLETQLVKLTAESEANANSLAEFETMKQEHEQLLLRHQTALELMGEREEQVEELHADLMDVKQLYRSQISELVSRIEELEQARK